MNCFNKCIEGKIQDDKVVDFSSSIIRNDNNSNSYKIKVIEAHTESNNTFSSFNTHENISDRINIINQQHKNIFKIEENINAIKINNCPNQNLNLKGINTLSLKNIDDLQNFIKDMGNIGIKSNSSNQLAINCLSDTLYNNNNDSNVNNKSNLSQCNFNPYFYTKNNKNHNLNALPNLQKEQNVNRIINDIKYLKATSKENAIIISFFGDQEVGKSELINRLKGNPPELIYIPTIGIEMSATKINYKNQIFIFNFIDTCGVTYYSNQDHNEMIYEISDIVLYVYDFNKKSTLEFMMNCFNKFQKYKENKQITKNVLEFFIVNKFQTEANISFIDDMLSFSTHSKMRYFSVSDLKYIEINTIIKKLIEAFLTKNYKEYK